MLEGRGFVLQHHAQPDGWVFVMFKVDLKEMHFGDAEQHLKPPPDLPL